MNPDSSQETSIAIIGLAGRYPGAANVDQYWRNLRDGVESVRFFSRRELAAAGVPDAMSAHPDWVGATAEIDDAEWFDGDFFGISPREARMTDPQHRIFLECAWEALESSGYNPAGIGDRVGIFAGCSINTYLLSSRRHAALLAVDPFAGLMGADKDFLTTRVSYKLDLKGPSVTVQTACSTSLVAVHLACQSLQTGECEMALAGGVSVRFPRGTGYLYQEGGILSPDGHCRAFDARAQGTVGGEGVGIVVLKRLYRPWRTGTIRAVIRGSAVNNDGSQDRLHRPASRARSPSSKRRWPWLRSRPIQSATSKPMAPSPLGGRSRSPRSPKCFAGRPRERISARSVPSRRTSVTWTRRRAWPV